MSSEFERLIQTAIAEAKLGNKRRAKEILAGAVRREPQNARVWYLLSQVVEGPEQAVECLNRVLAIDPDNLQAKARLEKLRSEPVRLKPKKSSVGVLIWVALAIVACVGIPLCLAGVWAGYNYFAAPAALNLPVDKRATIDQALAATMASIPSDTVAPTRTATTRPTPTSTEKPTKIPTLTPITVVPVAAAVNQPATSGGFSACIPVNKPIEAGIVTRVIDGDTIEAFVDGQTVTIRYIGIDTPETVKPGTGVQYFGPEASEKNKQLVEGKNVILVKDVSQTDQYDRLLRYVLVGDLGGLFVNYELVRQGFALASTYPPDVACAETFVNAQHQAAVEGVGLWKATPIPTVTPIVVVQPTAGNGAGELRIISLTSPIDPGATAILIAKTTPGARCMITVYHKSGPSTAQGLEPKIAGTNGIVSWTWIVGARTTPGEWRIEVTATISGQTYTQSIPFIVR
jgi:endonuclease YncB( thermonuclease family)